MDEPCWGECPFPREIANTRRDLPLLPFETLGGVPVRVFGLFMPTLRTYRYIRGSRVEKDVCWRGVIRVLPF